MLWLLLKTVPMSLLWALPTVGWLMFCSAWATSKPFLWAVLFPLLACVMLSILSAMPGISLPIGWIWYIVGYRGLLSALPGTWSPRAVSGNLDSSAMQTPATWCSGRCSTPTAHGSTAIRTSGSALQSA